jgi:hypothetical protein
MKLRLVFFLLFSLAFAAHATPLPKLAKPKTDTLKKSKILLKDTGSVDLRKLNGDSILKYSKQKEFIYDDVPPPATSNWWNRFWRWFWHQLNDAFDGKRGPFFKYLIIVLVIAIVTFGIIKLLGVDLKLLAGKSKAITVPYEESLENIHDINFDDQIEMAMANANYRLVVRLLYLKTLKNLTDKQLIFWQPEKTNQAYVLELKNEQDQLEFSKLTNQFEYIWYGEFHIEKEAFDVIQQSFSQFNKHVI